MRRLEHVALRVALVGATLTLVTPGCADTGGRWGTERYSREALYEALEQDEDEAGVLLGEFPLKNDAVIDGDTVKVGGLDGSLRLLGIDSEETFKTDADWRKYEVGWAQYLENETAKTSRPVKIATPVGMDGKHYAKEFFKGLTRIRLERDHPKEVRGRYNRFLAYIFVERDGEWINYNVESVRVGMSPYFTKYGYARRFHDEFLEAQEEARTNEVGIWEPGTEHYPDYDVRLPWWYGRAAFIEAFEREAEDRPDFISLTHWDSLRRMEELVGRDVTLLATVGSIYKSDRGGPTRVMLSRRMFGDFPLVVFDGQVFEQSQLEKYKGEYIRVRGMVTTYKNKKTGEQTLQITLRNAGQVTTPTYFIPGVQQADGELGPAMPAGAELPVGPFEGPSSALPHGDDSPPSEPAKPEAPQTVSSPAEPLDGSPEGNQTPKPSFDAPPPDDGEAIVPRAPDAVGGSAPPPPG